MSTAYGVYPERHRVEEDQARKRIVVATPYYEIEHDLDRGGQIGSVRFPAAGRGNIFLEPAGVELRVAGVSGPFAPAGRTAVRIDRRDGEAVLEFDGPLVDAGGKPSGVHLRTRYAHRWGYVRVRQELEFPGRGLDVSGLLLHRWVLSPELTHFGVRPGAPAETSASTTAFGVCQWGRFRPGRSFDSPYVSRFVPRYVCFADPGRCGIEWFVGSLLEQWDYQVAGRPGLGHLRILPMPSPPSVRFMVSALSLMGSLRLRGRYVFDSYIGVPILAGRANPPFVHKTFQRKPWPTDGQVRQWARGGIRTAHFHHDGDTFRDGQFWRDGSYPPFGPRDMREFDRVIAACRRNGIQVATYLSNKELHPSVPAYRAHGRAWARLPDDTARILHNQFSGDEFGAQMCLRSGWLDFHKRYINTVLTRHALHGTYFDWNAALYCHNARHTGRTPPPRGRLGAQLNSPAGHWDVDELLDLMEWTRQRVGPQGLMIVHNTMCPMAAAENFADYVVAMEWGYALLSTGTPDLDELPLEWSFMGARSRSVIGYGCLAKEAPPRLHRQMLVRCLLTGVTPWPADDLDQRVLAPLRGLDASAFTFHDWRSGLAGTDDPAAAAAAVYCRPDRAMVLVGELRGARREARVLLNMKAPAFPRGRRYRVAVGGRSVTVDAATLRQKGLSVEVPANGITPVWIHPVAERTAK